jgi:hypothetical protein
LKQHEPRFGEECLKLLDQRTQDNLQWLQNPSQTNINKEVISERENEWTWKKQQ